MTELCRAEAELDQSAEDSHESLSQSLAQHAAIAAVYGSSAPAGVEFEALTRARQAIERELSTMPPGSATLEELLARAEAIRDRVYRPLIQSPDHARAAQEQTREPARRPEKLEAIDGQPEAEVRPRIDHGVSYAARELDREGLDMREQSHLERIVKRELEQELTGEESDREVRDLVDEILDEELGEDDEIRDCEGCDEDADSDDEDYDDEDYDDDDDEDW